MSDSLRPHVLYSPRNSPDQSTGVGSLSLLQGILSTQGSNPGLPHCRRSLYQLSHKGSPSYRADFQNTGGKRLRTCHSHAGPQCSCPFIPPFSANVPSWVVDGHRRMDGSCRRLLHRWEGSPPGDLLKGELSSGPTSWLPNLLTQMVRSSSSSGPTRACRRGWGAGQSPSRPPTQGSLQDFQQKCSLPLATGK